MGLPTNHLWPVRALDHLIWFGLIWSLRVCYLNLQWIRISVNRHVNSPHTQHHHLNSNPLNLLCALHKSRPRIDACRALHCGGIKTSSQNHHQERNIDILFSKERKETEIIMFPSWCLDRPLKWEEKRKKEFFYTGAQYCMTMYFYYFALAWKPMDSCRLIWREEHSGQFRGVRGGIGSKTSNCIFSQWKWTLLPSLRPPKMAFLKYFFQNQIG